MNSDNDKELSTYFHLTKNLSLDEEISQPILRYESVTQYYNPSPPKILKNEESILSPSIQRIFDAQDTPDKIFMQYNNQDIVQSLPTIPAYLNINQTQYQSSVIKQSQITSQPATIPQQVSTQPPVIQKQTIQQTIQPRQTIQSTVRPTIQSRQTIQPTIQPR